MFKRKSFLLYRLPDINNFNSAYTEKTEGITENETFWNDAVYYKHRNKTYDL